MIFYNNHVFKLVIFIYDIYYAIIPYPYQTSLGQFFKNPATKQPHENFWLQVKCHGLDKNQDNNII